MKKAFTSLFFLLLAAMPSLAQEINETFMFVDEDYNVIENGATITRNVAVDYDGTSQVIHSGISVMDMGASVNDYLCMHYSISRIDNGSFQICFPTTCNYKDEEGDYVTAPGQLMGDIQDIQSEWILTGDGVCTVTLSIEVMSRTGFPPQYHHVANGPTITINFVKGDVPGPEPNVGDVNGDGEVTVSDVNALIDMILTDAEYAQAADVNADGEVSISDVNALIDIILNQN